MIERERQRERERARARDWEKERDRSEETEGKRERDGEKKERERESQRDTMMVTTLVATFFFARSLQQHQEVATAYTCCAACSVAGLT